MIKLSENIRIIAGTAVVMLMFSGYYFNTYRDMSYAPVYPVGVEVSTSPEISASELRAFLKTWNKYCRDGMDKVGSRQLSMAAQDSADEMNPEISRWLERKGWNVARFFYVEERLRAIVATIYRDRKIDRNRQMIKERLRNVKDPRLAAALKRFAENEAKKINVEQISPAERYMVEPQLEDIMAILKNEN